MSQDEDDVVEREERAVYAIIAIALAPVLIAVAIRGGIFDSGSTLCLLLVVAAIGGFASLARRLVRTRSEFPRARIHRR